jgi:hypothetical protein
MTGLATLAVTITGLSFSPSQATAVVGDAVTWRNLDFRDHDVRALDGAFDSGPLGRLGAFTVRLERAGGQPYVCTIHPFMSGQVDVVGALLAAPDKPVLAGAPLRLQGRSQPGASVTLERSVTGGAWERAGGPAAAGDDGGFEFDVRAVEGAAYRAMTAAGASPEVAPPVAARVDVGVAIRGNQVRVTTAPAQPGLFAVLQRYSRERYMWRRVDHARLDRSGRAHFVLRNRRGGRLRVLLSRSVRGTPLAVQRVE